MNWESFCLNRNTGNTMERLEYARDDQIIWPQKRKPCHCLETQTHSVTK